MKVGGSLAELRFFNLWDLWTDGIRIELNWDIQLMLENCWFGESSPYTDIFISVREFCVSWCSLTQSCPTLWDLMGCCTPGFPVLHYLPEFAQTHTHWVDDVIQPSHPPPPPSPALNLSQHQGLFQWVSTSSHQVVKVLELQLQHQSFQWIFRTDFL